MERNTHLTKTAIIYNSLLLAIIAVFVALPLVKVPITISARGTIRPVQEDNKILSVVSGRIIYSCLDKNNQTVQKGDTLLIVMSDVLRNKSQHQTILFRDYRDQLNDLINLLSGDHLTMRTGLYQMESASLRERLAEIETQVTLAKREFDRNSALYEQGIIPLSEYDKSLYTHQQLQNQLRSVEEQQRAVWQAKKREIEQQLAGVRTEQTAVEIESGNYIVKAPADGRITNLQGFTAGNYIMQGQHIADISAENNLIAECYVPASSIGFIQPEQRVRFQIDTYNYNQWGMLHGTVEEIDYNIMTNEQTGESFFRVRCRLEDDRLSLKNGYQATVGKGNTYSARFHLTDRTLWELLFDRVDDWFNPALANR